MENQSLQKVLQSGLYEYGSSSCPLSQKWKPLLSHPSESHRLLIAYNNSDSTFASLPLFVEDGAAFAAGIRFLQHTFSFSEILFYLPDAVSDSALEPVKTVLAKLADVPVQTVCGKVIVQDLLHSDLLHHPETIENIGRVLNGEAPMLYVKIHAGAEVSQVHIPLETTVCEALDIAGVPYAASDWLLIGGQCGSLLRAKEGNVPLYGYGNSAIEVLPEPFCMVHHAAQAAVAAFNGSCGRCTFCREGNYQLSAFLNRTVNGRGQAEDLTWIPGITKAVEEESCCSFGKESVRFLRETWERHKEVYNAHIKEKRCDTNVCQAFTDYAIDGALCIGCDHCHTVCAPGAIKDQQGYVHRINAVLCTKCGQCIPVCPKHAIKQVRSGRQIGPFKKTKVGYYRNSRKPY